MPIDRALLSDYFTGKRKHGYYEISVEMANAFLPHSDGVYPEKLIEGRRPNEPLEIKAYRKEIWKPKTKPTFGRVLSSLGKIRRSSDWSISYPKDDFSLIREGEGLQEYCEENFPYYDSATNWAFGELLKTQLIDPNTVCVVMPLSRTVDATDFIKPYPFLYPSVDVIEFVENDYVLLNNPAGSVYYTDRGKMVNVGKSFYYIDSLVIEKWNQINAKGDMKMEWDYQHGLEVVPFFKLYGLTIKTSETQRLNASRIEDMLPELDEAVREYSDLQAGKVLHMYPEKWKFASQECQVCSHTGWVPNPNWLREGDPDKLPCTAPGCRGGYIAKGPFSEILVTPTDMGLSQQASPIPPAGYISKPVEILDIMEKSVVKHIYDGLAAINFQFLEQSPLNQSGAAKEVDKDELNNTVHAIAEDLVRALDRVYRLIALYRYKTQYPGKTDEMLPKIDVPERFDILSANHLGEQLTKAKTAGLNPAILNKLEISFAVKTFNSDHDVSELLGLVLSLDPLSNITEDDKISRLSNKGVTLRSYVISSNIQAFVQRAVEEDEGFVVAELSDQIEVMNRYADELIQSMDTATKITTDVIDEETDPAGDEL